jgi:hypothetical protein
MDLDDRAATFRLLARDRAGQSTATFGSVLVGAGIDAVRIPLRCPRATAPPGRITVGEHFALKAAPCGPCPARRSTTPSVRLRPTYEN